MCSKRSKLDVPLLFAYVPWRHYLRISFVTKRSIRCDHLGIVSKFVGGKAPVQTPLATPLVGNEPGAEFLGMERNHGSESYEQSEGLTFHQVKLSSNFLTFHYVSFASWCFCEVCLGSDFSINLK
jgi:hypothetical protein